MTRTTELQVFHDPEMKLTVTARAGLNGCWLVTFIRRGRNGHKVLDQCAAWLPGGWWDERRWHPMGARLVPAAVVLEVEQWLRGYLLIGDAQTQEAE